MPTQFHELQAMAEQSKGQEYKIQSVREKIDLAYERYFISLEQWSQLYEILMDEQSILPNPPSRNLSPVYQSFKYDK